jgi:hypothetical protein
MRRVTATILFLLMLYVAVAKAVETKPLLEVRVSSSGMVAFVGEYLHLRVFDDGRIEYEDRKEGESKFVLRETKLSSSQLQSLKEFLDSSEVQNLDSEYPPASPTIDHHTLIQISINRADTPQSIKIPNFNLPMGKDKGLYSQSLINLMCRIEEVRGNASLRLTAKGWCTIWSK